MHKRKKRLWRSAALIIGVLLLVAAVLSALVKSEPTFYTEAVPPAGPVREQLSKEAIANWLKISSALDDANWQVVFSDHELNSFLQEDYHQWGGDDNLPDGLSDPRVKIEDGKMRIGVRYGKGLTSIILAIEVRLWKVKGEINTLAMEIVSLRAGSLPISSSTLLDAIGEAVRRENVDISWYRNAGHPVAIMRFQANQTLPTFHFDAIEMKDGKLTISGRSTESIVGPPPRVN